MQGSVKHASTFDSLFGLGGEEMTDKHHMSTPAPSLSLHRRVFRLNRSADACTPAPDLRTCFKPTRPVVSPLISLIEDQTRYLNDLVPGSAAMLSAGMDKKETADVYRKMRGEPVEGGSKGAKLVMVLVTPEKVGSQFCTHPTPC